MSMTRGERAVYIYELEELLDLAHGRFERSYRKLWSKLRPVEQTLMSQMMEALEDIRQYEVNIHAEVREMDR